MGLLAGTIFDRPLHCERCNHPDVECRCRPGTTMPLLLPADRQTARFSVEKRKKGKCVTVISGLYAADNDYDLLLKKLKNACGAGGTIEGDLIEIQGDQIDRAKKVLAELGYKVR